MKLPFVRRWRNASRGQALVETALVLPILIMLLLLGIDLGRIFFTSIDLRNAAHEATMFGGVPKGALECNGPDPRLDIKVVVDREMGRNDAICSPSLGPEVGVVYITEYQCERPDGSACDPNALFDPTTDRDVRYVVRLEYRFQPVMPLVGLLTGNGAGGSVPMAIENRSPMLKGFVGG